MYPKLAHSTSVYLLPSAHDSPSFLCELLDSSAQLLITLCCLVRWWKVRYLVAHLRGHETTDREGTQRTDDTPANPRDSRRGTKLRRDVAWPVASLTTAGRLSTTSTTPAHGFSPSSSLRTASASPVAIFHNWAVSRVSSVATLTSPGCSQPRSLPHLRK